MTHPSFSVPPVFAVTRPPPPSSTRRRTVALATLFAGVAVACLAAQGARRLDSLPSAGVATMKHASDGAAVRWACDSVVMSVAPSMRDLVSDAPRVVSAALAAWSDAHPKLPQLSVAVDASDDEPDDGPPRVNAVRLVPEHMTLPGHALAVTLLTFDTDTGVIVGAQILVDARHHAFAELDADDPSSGAFDLQALLTHEMGHVLGLGEDYDDAHATMYVSATPGDTKKRVLTDADRQALAPLYDDASSSSDSTHGGCAVGAIHGGSAWWIPALVAVGCLVRRRRLALLGLVALAALAPSSSSADEGDAEVVAVDSRWQQGVVVTTLSMRDASGRVLPPLEVLGGTVGRHSQLASGALPPSAGARVSRGWLGRSAIEQRAK